MVELEEAENIKLKFEQHFAYLTAVDFIGATS
jgi:hypothetical protein